MKIRDIKSIDKCNLCMKFHAQPHHEHICYENKYPRFETMPDKEKMLAEIRDKYKGVDTHMEGDEECM